MTFILTISNSDGAFTGYAYDVTIIDMLPAPWTSMMVDSIIPSGGVTGVVNNSAGTLIDIQVDIFPPDGELTIVYTATAAGPLAPGTLTNLATATWTSLPDTHGSGDATPGDPGDADGERTGGGGAPNDSTTFGTADVVVGEPALTKSVVDLQSRYAIGDTVDYLLRIALPPTAVLNDSLVSDVLAEGLTYVAGSLAISYPAGVSSSTDPAEFSRSDDDPSPGEETLTLDLGTLTNADDAIQTLSLTYRARVDNIYSNQNNQNLPNDAIFGFQDPGGGGTVLLTDGQSVTVGEAHLALDKAITGASAGLDAGDAVDFRVLVSNDGTTTAFDSVVGDSLPTGLENITGLVVAATSGGAEIPVLNNNGSDWSTSPFDIPAGGSITIDFTAYLGDGVIPGQSIQNSAQVTFTSRDGADPNERDGGDPGSDQDDDGDLDNYNAGDSAPTIIVADSVAIDKTFAIDPADDTYAIGEIFSYRLTISLIEGAKDDLSVIDTLPDGVRFISSLSGVGNLGMTLQTNDPPIETGQTLRFDFGRVTNPANGNAGDDFLTIDISVVIEDIIANMDGTVLGNQASLTFTGPAGTVIREFDADSSAPGAQPLDLTIVEPDVTLTKSADRPIVPPGDRVTFSLILDQTVFSNADAFDLHIVDTLPPGLTYIPGSATLLPVVSGQTLTFDLAALTLLDDQFVISYQAAVDPDVVFGTPLTNNAVLDYSSQPGVVADEREYSDADSATVTPDAAGAIDAVKTVMIAVDNSTAGVADPGDTLTYTIVLENQGDVVENLVFTDEIPHHTSYVPGSLSSTAGGEDDSGNPLRVVLASLAAGASVTISFQVTIDAGTPAGSVITNQGRVDSDQTVPEPTDGDDNDDNGDQPTDITVGGPVNIANALYVEKFVAWIDDADASGDVSLGDGLRYTLLFHNRGAGDLHNLAFSDTIPAGLTYVPASETISGTGATISIAGQAVSASIPVLSAAAVESASFEVRVATITGSSQTFVNQGSATSDETGPTLTDDNGDPTDGNHPTTITAVNGVPGSPVLDLEKRWALEFDTDGDGLVDPGDSLRYSLMLRNTGSAIAEDVILDDAVPAGTSVVVGSVTASQGIVISEDPVAVNISDLEPGGIVTVVFAVVVDAATPAGTILSNQAVVSGANFPDTPSDDNGNDGDGPNPTLTPVDGGGGTGSPSGLAKILAADSEPGSVGGDVLIGEIVTFEVTFAVPAGTLREVTISDSLPSGLQYLNGSAALKRLFDTGLTASQDPGGVNQAPTDTYVPLADGTALAVDNGSLALFLGDLINSDNDPDQEAFVLSYRALVRNIAANQPGTDLVNSAGLSYLNALSQVQQLSPVSRQLHIVAASLVAAKSANPTAILPSGGDVIFTLTVTNPTGADSGPAYDVRLHDMLPAVWTSISVDNILPAGGVAGVVDNSSGTVLDIGIAEFPAGGSLTVTLTATAGPLPPGTTTNTANVTWTSLPGTNGTAGETPGMPGDPDGERTGSGNGPNDEAADASAEVAIGELNLTKSLTTSQVRYAIGDTIGYRLAIALPPTADLDNVGLTDILDEGLSYAGGSLTIQYPSGVASSNDPVEFTRTLDLPAPGQETLTLNLGTLTNGNPTVQTILLDYTVLVDNVPVNQSGRALENNAALTFDDPGGGGAQQREGLVNAVIGEPHLAFTKTITSALAGLDAGDSVAFQLDIANDGTTTAYETLVADVLPAGLENAANLMVTALAGGAEMPVFTNNGSDWATSEFAIPPGGSLTIVFTAILADDVTPGQTIQNLAEATFSSRDGADANERDGSDAGSDQDDDGDLNNYRATATSQAIVLADPVALDKRFHPDPSNDSYTIGEVVAYRLTVALIEGSLGDLVVTDVLPAGVTFVDALVGVGNLGMSHDYLPPPQQTGQTLTFNFGDVVNPADGNGTNDFITIDIQVTVDNDPFNQNGTRLGNNASLSFSGPGGTEVRDFDADVLTPGVQPLELAVVLPELEIEKTASQTELQPGSETLFTLTLAHTAGSSADAFDLEVSDVLPPELTYVPGSASVPVVAVGQTLVFDVARVPLGGAPVTITYRVLLAANAPIGTPVTNQAEATYTTLAGPDANERTGVDGPGGLNNLVTAGASASVTPSGTALAAAKTAMLLIDQGGDGAANPGDTLRYRVALVNNGNLTATGLVFSDTLDANTQLVVDSVTTTQGTVISGNTAGDMTVNVALGSLAAGGASAVITYDAVIALPFPAGVDQVSNQGVISGNEFPDVPSDDPDTDEEGDPTIVPVEATPVLAASKIASLGLDADGDGYPSPGDTLIYTLVVSNNGDQDGSGLILDDMPDVYTNLVVGSVSTSQGTVLMGNTAGDQVVRVAIGAVTGDGGSATVTFGVRVANPLPVGVTQVANQAVIQSDDTPPLLSDDPDVPGLEDPTVTQLRVVPVLLASKTDVLAVDADGSGGPSPGDTLEYIITLINQGSGEAAGATFADTPDANTVLVPGSVTTSQGNVTSGNDGNPPVLIALGDIPGGGASATVTFRIRVVDPLPAGVTVVANQGRVDADDLVQVLTDDPDRPGNADETLTFLTGAPALAAAKTDMLIEDANGDSKPSPGDTLLYVIQILNNGNASASNVVFTDSPDGNTTLVAGSIQSSQGTVLSGDDGIAPVQVQLGTLNGGGDNATVSFRVRVNRPLPALIGQVANQAVISCNELPDLLSDDPDIGGAADPTVTAIFQADLAVTKTGPTAPVFVGTDFDYTIEVRNQSPSGATSVRLIDTLPAQAAYLSVKPDQGSCQYDAGTHTLACSLGDLAAQATSTVALRVHLLEAGQSVNSVAVTALEIDPDESNNTDTAVVVGQSGIDLELSKSAQPTDLDFGDLVTYTLTLKNQGPDVATNVAVKDLLPPSLVFQSAEASIGTYDPQSGHWSLADLASGAQATLAIGALTQEFGVITNSAEVTAADQQDSDSTPGNGDPAEDDQASVDITVGAVVDLAITKTVEPQSAPVGSEVTYTLTVDNYGPGQATSVQVFEIMPEHVNLVNVMVSQGSFDANTGIWSLETMPVETRAEMEIVVTIGEVALNTRLINRARVTCPEPESEPGNNMAQAELNVYASVPVLGPAGMIAMVLTLLTAALWLRRRRPAI